ncbi:MAG: hypothetical protein R3Y05_06335 [bacterium]
MAFNQKTDKEKFSNYFTYIKNQEKAFVNKNQKMYVRNIKSAEIANAKYNNSYYNVNKSNSIKSKVSKIIIDINDNSLNLSGGNIFDKFFSFIFSCGFGPLLVIYGFVV